MKLYIALNIIELITVFGFGVFLFIHKEKTYPKVIQLICAFILFFCNIIQLPMEIIMRKSYNMTIFVIILWLVNIVLIGFGLIKNKK